MKSPNVNLKLAKQLADNYHRISTLREACIKTTFGSEQAIVYSDALDPLYEERDKLINEAMK